MARNHLVLVLSIISIGSPLVAAGTSGVIQPASTSLGPLQQQQFTLPGYGNNITWSVQPAGMGNITSTGFYTAFSTPGVAYIYAKPAGSNSLFVSTVYQSLNGSTGAPATGTGPSWGAPPSSPGPGTPAPGAPAPTPAPGPTWGSSPSAPSPSPTWGPSPSGPTSGNPTGGPTPYQPGQGPSPFAPSSGPTGISLSISPATMNLQAGQSISFFAQVQGSTDKQLQWSLSPNVGSLVNGVYTAPKSINYESQVTVSATSMANPTVTATATVLLTQPISMPPLSNVSISISQGTPTLAAGQSAQFTALVQGTASTGVLWTLMPNVGTVVNGLYTAPASITQQETIMLTASSAADPSKTAQVSLILKPAAAPPVVSISLSPSNITIDGGQSTTFMPTVTGTSNTAVTWSLNPSIGTITNGVYAAPAIIASQQTVTVTAKSTADSTKTASATLTLQPIGVTV